MKISNTERTYCFEITERQYQRMLDKSDRAVSGDDTFINRVCSVPGVRSVWHDPMFGPAIHVAMEEPFEETLEKVKNVIAEYIR